MNDARKWSGVSLVRAIQKCGLGMVRPSSVLEWTEADLSAAHNLVGMSKSGHAVVENKRTPRSVVAGYQAWLRGGRESIIITQATADRLKQSPPEDLSLDVLPLMPGKSWEILLTEPVGSDGPDGADECWGGIVYCTSKGWTILVTHTHGAEPGEVFGTALDKFSWEFWNSTSLKNFTDAEFAQLEKAVMSSNGAPHPALAKLTRECFRKAVPLLLSATLALLNPTEARTKPIRLSERRSRRQARKAGQSMRTLLLNPSASSVVTVKRTLEGDRRVGEREPAQAHIVKSHGAIRWVRAPHPGEEVIDKKITRTVVVDGVEQHVMLFAVRRQRQAHIRGKGGLVSCEPKLSVVQGGG